MRFYNKTVFLYFFIFTLLMATPSANAGGVSLSVDPLNLVIQFVIFLLGLYLLNTLIFRPLLRIQDRRDELTAGTLRNAEEMTRRAEDAIGEYNEKLAQARSQANEARNELRQQGQSQSSTMLAEAKESAQTELESARRTLGTMVAGIRTDLEVEIESLAAEITDQVLRSEGQR